MLTYEQLKEKLKDVAYTVTEDNNKAIIDLVSDDGVYISQWNKSLKNYERIFFKNEEFLKHINEGEWHLKTDKIECTLDSLIRKRRNIKGYDVFIKGINKLKEEKDIAKGELTEGDYVYNGRGEMRFIEINDKANKRYLVTTKKSAEDTEERIEMQKKYAYEDDGRYWYKREKLASGHTYNSKGTITLKELIFETLGVKLKDVLITDLPKDANI